jgi:hypothetical protein
MGQFVNPQNTTTDIAGIVDTARNTVTDKFTQALQYADGAMNEASAFLNALQSAAEGFGFTITSLSGLSIAPISYEFNPGEAPVPPDAHLDLPALPTTPILDVINIEAIPIPSFDAVEPIVVIPDAPGIDLPNPPSDIPAVSDPDLPEKPVLTLPREPTFLQVTIPEIPQPDFPVFDLVAPDESLIVPENVIAINPGSYSSALLTALQNKLLNELLNGSDGLNPAVEDSIWRREEERARLALDEAKEKIASEWSKRGFDLPDGVLAANLAQADIEYANKRLDFSRDIAIKQAELVFQNGQFIIQQILGLENTLINFTNAVAERTFQQTKALQDASLAIFQASLHKYNAQLEAYKARAAVYESRIRAELAKGEFYKLMVQTAQVTADVNRAYADLYRLQIGAVEALINMYRSEMEAAKLQTEIDRTRVDAFKTQVEAYVARVNAKSAEFNMYGHRIEAEKAKIEVFGEQVRAYGARVDAVKAAASIRVEEARARIERNKELIERYRVDLEGYKTQIQAAVEALGAKIKVYEGEGQVYKAKSDAQAAIANVDAKVQEAAIMAEINQMNLFLKQAEINIKSYEMAQQLRMEAAKGGAQVAAQLAAGIFSGVSVQAHLSASAQAGKHYSGQESVSESYPHKEF